MSTILNKQQQDYLKDYLNVNSFKNPIEFNNYLHDSFHYDYQMIFLGRTDKLNSDSWNILVCLIKHFSSDIPAFEYHERKKIKTIDVTKELKQSIFEDIASYLTALYFPITEQPKKSFIQKIMSLFK